MGLHNSGTIQDDKDKEWVPRPTGQLAQLAHTTECNTRATSNAYSVKE